MSPRLTRWTPAVILMLAGSACSLAAGPFGATIDLSLLDGSDGFALEGISAADRCGHSVAGAGDINGDGIDDLIIGAFYGDPNGASDSGESYVVFGSAGIGAGGLIELSSLNGTNGFVCNGVDPGDSSGFAVAPGGDLNGDGIDDLLIGARFASPNGVANSGESYVVFGGAGIGAGGSLELSALNGANGFVCNGGFFLAQTGATLSCAGDVNGDGIDDLIIGNSGTYSGPGTDQSYIVFGGVGVGVGAGGVLELASLNGANGFACLSGELGDGSGGAVSSAGDVNDDGIDDLLIGAERSDLNGSSSGACAVLFGGVGIGAGGTISLGSLNGANGFTCLGATQGKGIGQSVAQGGDFNGDGVDDLIIGSMFADPNGVNSGESYIVYGAAGIGSGGALDFSTLNGANGVVIEGQAARDYSGFSVSSAGDVNGDGLDDLIVGGYGVDSNGDIFSGASHIVFGNTTGAKVIDLAAINGINGFVCTGVDAQDRSGRSVAGAGDINGDGVDDLIIGAHLADPDGINSGASYVIFGKATLAADLNNDGIVDTADLGILLGQFGLMSP